MASCRFDITKEKGIYCSVNVPYLYEHISNNAIYGDGMYAFTCDLANMHDVINEILQYCLNNPIIYIYETMLQKRPTSELYQYASTHAYTKTLLYKAITDFNDLKLIIQASSV